MNLATLAQLATIDPSTGAATLIGQPLGGNFMMMGLIVSPEGVLYGAGDNNTSSPTYNSIYRIDTTTGLPTWVGKSGANGFLMSFA